MSLGIALQDPDGQDRYEFDWAPELGSLLIDSSVWTIVPVVGGAPIVSQQTVDGLVTSCLVSGISAGTLYELENAVTPSGIGNGVRRRSIMIRGGHQ